MVAAEEQTHSLAVTTDHSDSHLTADHTPGYAHSGIAGSERGNCRFCGHRYLGYFLGTHIQLHLRLATKPAGHTNIRESP